MTSQKNGSLEQSIKAVIHCLKNVVENLEACEGATRVQQSFVNEAAQNRIASACLALQQILERESC